ncbi:hypothetical protein HDU96_008238 [Phlyctochytrium bullatum]|nr:hypothetical protein HDU96_008238 [Phlyctochytrium bullatum]
MTLQVQPEKTKRAQVFEIDDVTADDISDVIELLKRKKLQRAAASSASRSASTFQLVLSVPKESMPSLIMELLEANSKLRSGRSRQEVKVERERESPADDKPQPVVITDTKSSKTVSDRDAAKEKFDQLVAAAERNDQTAVKHLLANGAEWRVKDSKGRLPIEISSSPAVWAAFAAVYRQPKMSVWEAAKAGDAVSLRLLIATGHDYTPADKYSATLLHTATRFGHANVVEVLVKGCSLSTELPTTAFFLDERNNRKKSSEETGFTALHVAAMFGHASVVRKLAELGANGNAPTSFSRTALHIATEKGFVDVVQALIDHGANVKSADTNGNTPLHIVAKGSGNVRLAQLILSALGPEFDLNMKAKGSWTPLHMAAEVGNAAVAELLLTKGATVNAVGGNRWTPLHVAAYNGHRQVVELLKSRGADTNARTGAGMLPAALAKEKGHHTIMNLIRGH